MKIIDSTEARIALLGDKLGIELPQEYEDLEGLPARLEAATEDGRLVFLVRPSLDAPVRDTVGELWRDLRLLFSDIADIGEQPPWEDLEIVWEAGESGGLGIDRETGSKLPISAAEVLEHRRIYRSRPLEWDKEDIRKSIKDTLTKLCELAARRLGFRSSLFAVAFGDAVANKFSLISCTYGTLDVICEIFSEEFTRHYDDRYWSLASPRSREAVARCFAKIKGLEENPAEFQKERARVQQKWGFPLQSP